MNRLEKIQALSVTRKAIMKKIQFQRKRYYESLDSTSILLHYASKSSEKEEINYIVENGEFLAYDIAIKLLVSDNFVTPAQRKALINVISYFDALVYLGIIEIEPLSCFEKKTPLYNEGISPRFIKKKGFDPGDVVMVKQGIFFKGMDGTKEKSLMFELAKSPLTINYVVSTHSNSFQNRYTCLESRDIIWHGYMIEGLLSFATSHKSLPLLPLI